jgi:hypothetical protein
MMSFQIRSSIAAAIVLAGLTAGEAVAQPGGFLSGTDIQFNAGQSVQPIFDGWTRNADGSYQLHFGYLNRNYVEEIHVPVGPDNMLEPAGPDRGQPTYFYTRFNRRLFSVTVPRDFGKGEVVWTLKTNGRTEKAVGWLQPEWEIEGSAGSEKTKNVAPAITVAPPTAPVALSAKLPLTAKVSDDGLPKPGKPRVGGNSENPPAFRPDSKHTPPVNVPTVQRTRPVRLQGLSVAWRVWRGPGAVTFEPATLPVKDGQAATTATFSKPGEYVLRAIANDSAATTVQDIKVVVTDGAASSGP